MSNDLATFLLARIGEDEEAALAATAGSWEVRPYWFTSNGRSWASVRDVINEDIDAKDADHIARWDPARVLAECAVRRQLVELHRLGGSYTAGGEESEGFDYCATCGSGEPYEYPTQWPCATLRLLALPYADHPSFDPAWRPERTA